MKRLLIFLVFLSTVSWAQSGAYPPLGGIPQNAQTQEQLNQNAQTQRAQAELLRQQTELLKQQTEALRRQNELMKQQQAQAATVFISPVRKPKIDDIDAVTGRPRFANFAEYEDAKDEWLIGEALRRFEALHPAAGAQKKDAAAGK